MISNHAARHSPLEFGQAALEDSGVSSLAEKAGR